MEMNPNCTNKFNKIEKTAFLLYFDLPELFQKLNLVAPLFKRIFPIIFF